MALAKTQWVRYRSRMATKYVMRHIRFTEKAQRAIRALELHWDCTASEAVRRAVQETAEKIHRARSFQDQLAEELAEKQKEREE